MLYQSDSEYVFDSSKFSKAFGQEPTSYAEGIRCIALAYKSRMRAGLWKRNDLTFAPMLLESNGSDSAAAAIV